MMTIEQDGTRENKMNLLGTIINQKPKGKINDREGKKKRKRSFLSCRFSYGCC